MAAPAPVFRLESVLGEVDRLTFERAADLLVAAFFDDPFYGHIMRDRELRARALSWWMRTFLKNGLASGEVLVTGEPGAPTGAAIWLGPEKPVPDALRLMRLGLIRAPLELGPTGFSRMMAVTDHWQALHRREHKPHRYLNFLGVHPSMQGKGLGSALIRAMTERADREGLNCYLETCTETNVRIYERHGFAKVEEKAWTGGENPWKSWTMRRPARAGV